MRKNAALLLLLLIFAVSIHAQETYQLNINGVSLQQLGKSLPAEQSLEQTLTNKKTQSIQLYASEDGLTVNVDFTPVFKGRRMKLKRNIYVNTPEGRKVQSRQKKAVQLLKVSVNESMKGRDSVSILYDKKKRKSIFVKYDYILKYN
ncbi:MAG: hypothetical protein PHG67_14095 [Bacteroidales bacterium]|nr:hypothetical protein [Bacteroidales bacterium]HOI31732.1 hypothetical protein [Bacteroidales bacterium]